jgi:hypothetical protein
MLREVGASVFLVLVELVIIAAIVAPRWVSRRAHALVEGLLSRARRAISLPHAGGEPSRSRQTARGAR